MPSGRWAATRSPTGPTTSTSRGGPPTPTCGAPARRGRGATGAWLDDRMVAHARGPRRRHLENTAHRRGLRRRAARRAPAGDRHAPARPRFARRRAGSAARRSPAGSTPRSGPTARPACSPPTTASPSTSRRAARSSTSPPAGTAGPSSPTRPLGTTPTTDSRPCGRRSPTSWWRATAGSTAPSWARSRPATPRRTSRCGTRSASAPARSAPPGPAAATSSPSPSTRTGEVVALTELFVNETMPHRSFQGGTLVMPGHRGHRLGVAVKVANLRALTAAYPRRRVGPHRQRRRERAP